MKYQFMSANREIFRVGRMVLLAFTKNLRLKVSLAAKIGFPGS